MADEWAELGVQGYLYGFPLVFDVDQVRRYVTTGVGANPAAPFNQFSHARTLAGPQDTFVSINNDTVYSMAQLDVSVGPVRLHVPDTAGRYSVLQFVDAWTNNFAYIGQRATGTGEGDYLLVPPGWSGDAPQDVTVIHLPTRVASIVGRWACTGVEDLPAVHALQNATTLTPLDAAAEPAGLPEPDTEVPENLAFWEKLRLYSQAFPPPERDRALQQSLAPLGVTQTGDSPYREHPREAELTAAITAGKAKLDSAVRTSGTATANGWRLSLHSFDYNLDFYEVGALDDPNFKISDPQTRLLERAVVAMAGLWGNHAYEAAYAVIYTDNDGDQLTGQRSYTLHLAPTPAVGAFWSLTMYEMPDYFLVANDINRYSLGDRTPGIVYNDDQSLTITISATHPSDPTALANWLPTPDGNFRPVLRMYVPATAILNQTYEIPPIIRNT